MADNVITIDGKEYKPEDLSGEQTYLISQIQDLQSKASGLRFQLDQVQVSLNAFTNALIKTVKDTEDEAVKAEAS